MKTGILFSFLLVFSYCQAADSDPRSFPAAQLFINNHKHGDTNGCSGDLGPTGQITCGHPGHVSEVTWKFLRSTAEGDLFHIIRKYPSDLDSSKTDTKEITFSGKPIIVWQDEYQKIILRPVPKAQQ